MRINKQQNKKAVTMFSKNKYITKFDIVDSLSWIDSEDHSKGLVDEYVYVKIDTNISSIIDLDIFMKDFLASPLRHIDADIKHNIKDMYNTTEYLIAKITTKTLNTNEEQIEYKIIVK